jgi:hypothetical protein
MQKIVIKYQYWLLLIFLLGGFLVRLYRIDYPIADWHSWRQADTAAVTRNFVRYGVDIFHPKYDDFSDVSGKGLLNPEGFRFVEFPIYNLLHFTLFNLGKNIANLEIWGRLTTIFAGLISTFLLFLIVRRHSNPITGLLAAFFYLYLPFNIYFTRVILPDPLMVTFYLAALYFFDIFTTNFAPSLKLNRSKAIYLFLTSFFGSLAVLVKPAAIFFLLPITWWFWQKYKFKMFKVPQFLILNASFLIPFGVWRLWEYQYPQGIPASTWLFNGDHIRFKPAFWRWLFGERIGKLILGVWGVVPFVFGLINGNKFLPWAVSAFIYLSVFATGNVRHDYYQIPIIPIISILLALGTNYLLKQNLTGKLLAGFTLLMLLGMSWYDIRGNFNVNSWDIVQAGKKIDQITPKSAIVVAPYNGDTAFLYQTNRRGFAYLPFPIKDLIDRFNATYYVSVNYDDQTRVIMNKYTIVEENPKFVIVKLVEPLKEIKL